MIHVLALVAALAVAPESEGPRRAQSAGNLAQYFSNDDYPVEALRRGAQGTVAFRLDIDASGTPTACTIEQSSGDAALDQATCDIVRTRARFRPARDAQGRPVPDTHSARVTWRIDEASQSSGFPFAPIEILSALRSTSRGEFSCTMEVNGSPVRTLGVDECGFLAGSGADEALRRLGGEGELSLVLRISPDGQRERPAVADRGILVAHSEAQFTLSPDGRFAQCRSLPSRAERQIPGIRSVPDPCSFGGPGGTPPFAPAEDPTASRRGRFVVALYYRAGTPL